MKVQKLAFLCVFICSAVGDIYGQLTVSDGTPWTAAKSTPVKLVISGDVSIRSTVDLSGCSLTLDGTSQNVVTTPSVVLGTLTLAGSPGAAMTMSGDWTVNDSLILISGVLTPDLKGITYKGRPTLQGSTASYIAGIVNQPVKPNLFFPIGTASGYFPAGFSRVPTGTTSIGLEAVDGSPPFGLSAAVTQVLNTRYYNLTATKGAISGSFISLSTGSLNGYPTKGLVVLGADASNPATSLGGQQSIPDFISSTKSPAPDLQYLALGTVENPEIIIYDIITPYTQDGINDKLKISNIGYTTNTVTLMDRWGAVVHIWTNFRNYDDEANPNTDSFDFGKLLPGSYICVAEYTLDGVTQKVAQMVTVLKTN